MTLLTAINSLAAASYFTVSKRRGEIERVSIQVISDEAVDAVTMELLMVGNIAELRSGPQQVRGKAATFGANALQPDLLWRRAELRIDGVDVAVYGPMVQVTEAA
jgi:hypothetical protein